jgi:hypothetical protein
VLRSFRSSTYMGGTLTGRNYPHFVKLKVTGQYGFSTILAPSSGE